MASPISPSRPIRWGILGSGVIAEKFLTGLKNLTDAKAVSVASRNPENAQRLAARHGISKTCSSYEELVISDVDIIYIATPHHLHKEHALLCIEHQKAVLCEKPLCTSHSDAEALYTAAQQAEVFLMEAMWMRFIPAVRHFQQLVGEGLIGEPRLLRADFSFRTRFDPKSRLFDLKQGGGAILDVGIYPITLAHMLFGEPTHISGHAHIGESEVDEQAAFTLGFEGGQLASLSAATRTQMPIVARLFGTSGSLELPSPFFCPDRIIHYPGVDPDAGARPTRGLMQKIASRLRHPRGELSPRTISVPCEGNGYQYEAAAAGDCLRKGLTECPENPTSDTLAVQKSISRLLTLWNKSAQYTDRDA